MRLLIEFQIYADYYQFFIHDSNVNPFTDIVEPDEPRPDIDDRRSDIGSYRQGYITNGRTICFGTYAHLHTHWIEVYCSQEIPDFAQAERVIALPLQLRSGKVGISTLCCDQNPIKEISLKSGTWTVYLLAFNLGSDQLFLNRGTKRPGEHNTDDLSDVQLKARQDLERYQLIFVLEMQTPIGILRGDPVIGG